MFIDEHLIKELKVSSFLKKHYSINSFSFHRNNHEIPSLLYHDKSLEGSGEFFKQDNYSCSLKNKNPPL
jgi:hypothetical protein